MLNIKSQKVNYTINIFF